MSTLSRPIVDTLIANDGMYPGDHIRVVKIVKYTNAWGGESYGCIYEGGNPDAYCQTEFVQNPEVFWEYK